MSLDRDVAGLFCVGFHGTTPSPEVLELVRRGVYGVVLFGCNVVDAEQVAALTAELKRTAPGPLLVSVDQEATAIAACPGRGPTLGRSRLRIPGEGEKYSGVNVNGDSAVKTNGIPG